MAEKGAAFLLKKAPVGVTVTFTAVGDLCNYTAHGLSAGAPIIFTNVGGALPAALTVGQLYYAGTILTNSFEIFATKAKALAGTVNIALADAGTGTTTGHAMTTVAGMRSTSFTASGEEVDRTTKDSAGWRELLAGAGVTNFSISASGVYADDVGLQKMRVDAITKALDYYSLVFESGDEYFGLFQVGSVEQAGEHNGEVTYSISLSSSGAIALIDNV